MSTPAAINGKEIFELLREDLAAIEREFGRDTVSDVEAITEIGEYLRGGGGKRIRPAAASAFREAAQLSGTRRHPAGRSGRDHPHRDPGSRRHH